MSTVIDVLSMCGKDVTISTSTQVCWYDLCFEGQQVFTKEEMYVLFDRQIYENVMLTSSPLWMSEKDVENCRKGIRDFLADYDDTKMSLWFIVDEDNVYVLKIHTQCKILTTRLDLILMLQEKNVKYSEFFDNNSIVVRDKYWYICFKCCKVNNQDIVRWVSLSEKDIGHYVNNVEIDIIIRDFLIQTCN